MRFFAAGLVLISALIPGAVLANDTMATLGAGGLVFVTNDDIEMASEDLSISTEQVKVVYEFANHADTDQHILVAFPLPDITGSQDFMVSVPVEDEDNHFGFVTTFNGKPVDAELHQYAVALGIDQTEFLNGLGVPLAPFGEKTQDAINALSDQDKQELVHRGLASPMEYDAGQGEQTDYVPIWTLRSTYSWEADFPAGKTAEVVHTYRPSVGGTTGVSFLSEPSDGYDPAGDYKRKYCTDDAFLKAVRKTLTNKDEPWSAPFTETWLSYIWSTGANWSGSIGKFHLTIDKGAPENLISFCWDGKVEKTGPTTFEMEATDFYPPWDRELEVLILNRQK
jgi:hypothetical protein